MPKVGGGRSTILSARSVCEMVDMMGVSMAYLVMLLPSKEGTKQCCEAHASESPSSSSNFNPGLVPVDLPQSSTPGSM